MKHITACLLPLLCLIASCGPSKQDRQNIATVTCNMIAESRKIDGALRLQLINDARDDLGEKPFLGNDGEIIEAYNYGLCEPLVLNSKDYVTKLSLIKEADVQAREERNREIEEQAKKRREIAWAAQEAFNDSVDAYFSSVVKTPPKLIELSTSDPSAGIEAAFVEAEYECEQIKGFSHTVEIIFEGDYKSITDKNSRGICPDGKATSTWVRADLSRKLLLEAYNQQKSIQEYVKKVTITLTGSVSPRLDYLKPEGATTFSKKYTYTLYESVED